MQVISLCSVPMKDRRWLIMAIYHLKTLEMNNKRLLLLGVTIVGAGWMSPTPTPAVLDTEKTASNAAIAAASLSSSTSTTNNEFFHELFLAASIGSSNGVHLNPRALDFIQDYMKENWEELQIVRATGKPYFTIIEHILTQYGLPKE